MIDTILSVVAVLLLFLTVYAVVMCVRIAVEAGNAEREFWEQHERTVKDTGQIGSGKEQ